MSANAEEPPPNATHRSAWDLARSTLAHLYRGKTISDSDPMLVLADMAAHDRPAPHSGDGHDHLTRAYQELLNHVCHLAAELDERGVDLANSHVLGLSNDTLEILHNYEASIVRAVGLRGILRRRVPRGTP